MLLRFLSCRSFRVQLSLKRGHFTPDLGFGANVSDAFIQVLPDLILDARIQHIQLRRHIRFHMVCGRGGCQEGGSFDENAGIIPSPHLLPKLVPVSHVAILLVQCMEIIFRHVGLY